MKFSYFYRLLLLLGIHLLLQEYTYSQNIPSVPNSPEAAAFIKANNYQTNLNTGVPSITIPFYTIKAGGLELPIGLQYHSGGFKVNEKSGSVGIGWSTTTDLQITRSINGLDDFSGQGYYYNTTITPYYYGSSSGTDYNYSKLQLYNMASGLTDGAPDKFNYKLLNKSGSFYIVKNGQSVSFVPVPYDNIKIEFIDFQFIITDTDGTRYLFGVPGLPSQVTDNAAAGWEMSRSSLDFCGDGSCKVTTWKCKKIINATQTDAITFNYVSSVITKNSSGTDYFEYFFNPKICSDNSLIYPNHYIVNYAGSSLSALLSYTSFQSLSSPKYISYMGGQARSFNMIWKNPANSYNLETKQFGGPGLGKFSGRGGASYVETLALQSIQFSGGNIVFEGTSKLSSITLGTPSGEVKRMSFFQSYATPNYWDAARSQNGNSFNGTLYLDSIQVGRNNQILERYGFLYRNKFCFGDHLIGHDAWGYVNAKTIEGALAGALNYPPFFPSQTITQNNFGLPYYNLPQPDCNTSTTFNIIGGGDEFCDENAMQSGILKRIIYPTGGFTDFDYEANRFEIEEGRLILSGGLRIQKITDFTSDNLSTPSTQKYYTYGKLESGAGILLCPPAFDFKDNMIQFGNLNFRQTVYYGSASGEMYQNMLGIGSQPQILIPCSNLNCVTLYSKEYKTTYLPNSSLDMTYTGSPIYYETVTEYQIDHGKQTGKKVYEYYPADHWSGLSTTSWRSPITIPGTDYRYIREGWPLGLLRSETTFKMDGNAFVKVQENLNEYEPFVYTSWPRVVFSLLRNYYNITNSSQGSGSFDCYIQEGSSYTTGSLPIEENDFISGRYGVSIGKMLLKKHTESNYHPSGTLVNTTRYYYDNPNYVQPSRIEISSSKGASKMKSMKYTYDFPNESVYSEMLTRNIISPVIEEIVTSGIQELSRSKVNYQYFNNSFYAIKSKEGSVRGNALETDLTVNQYDYKANITEATGRDGLITSYLWGYERNQLVAQVRGLPYSIAMTGISQSELDFPVSDQTIQTELNKIRLNNTQQKVLVQSMSYKPLTGITSLVNASGIKDLYEYDYFGRLASVKDAEGAIKHKYDYSTPINFSSLALMPSYVSRPLWYTGSHCINGSSAFVFNGAFRNSVVSAKAADELVLQLAKNDAAYAPYVPCTTLVGDSMANLTISNTITQYTPYPPEDIEIDFFKDQSIFAAYWFPNNSPYAPNYNNNPEPYMRQRAIKEGVYQVVIKADASYRGRAVKFFLTGTDGTNTYVKTGDQVTITKGQSYSLYATSN